MAELVILIIIWIVVTARIIAVCKKLFFDDD
jgi:hypothetical protein